MDDDGIETVLVLPVGLSRLRSPPSVLAPASVTVVWVRVAMLGLDNRCSVLKGCEAGAVRGDLTYIHFSQWMKMKPGASLPALPSALELNPNALFGWTATSAPRVVCHQWHILKSERAEYTLKFHITLLVRLNFRS